MRKLLNWTSWHKISNKYTSLISIITILFKTKKLSILINKKIYSSQFFFESHSSQVNNLTPQILLKK
jgi:hypothetical protein